MARRLTTDIAVIGAGSAGLTTAYAASHFGARVVLIERAKMGGDCLNYGCVPSKALLAAAHQAAASQTEFGVRRQPPQVDFAAVHQHIQSVIASIAPNDSVERYESFGVKVIKGEAAFVSPTALRVTGGEDEFEIRAKFFAIASGSSPMVPPISGLASIPYLTNETIFSNTTLPEHLLIIGGGPIGVEMAQAHAQLGAKVTIVDMGPILPRDDQELVRLLREQLIKDGIEVIERVQVEAAAVQSAKQVRLTVKKQDGARTTISGSHLLVAAGRKANLAGLNLAEAGVRHSPNAIEVDKRLRTSNKRIYALGDVAGPYQFTHMASYHAGVVIRNMLFRLPTKVDYRAVPWVTYSSPEMAHCGLSLSEAQQTYPPARLEVLRWPFAENDRARAERATHGLAKAIVTRGGKILGVDILGPKAGELIQPWCLAIQNNLKIAAMASYIAPYPTLGEVNKRLAGSYYNTRLFNPRVQKLVRLLLRLPF